MMRAIAAVLVVAGLVGCGGKKQEGQSLKEAMEILCVTDLAAGVDKLAPAERMKAKFDWIDARLKNKEARDAFTRIAELAPSERSQVFLELAKKAKIDRCAAVEEAAAGGGQAPGMPLPELGATARGALPLDDAAPMVSIVATHLELVVEGNSILALQGGLPDASEVSGGSSGYQIDRLRALADAHVAEAKAKGRPLAGARLLFHPKTPARLLFMVIMSTKPVGWKQFELVARRDGAVVTIPITLPETPTSAIAGDLAEPPGLGIVVAVSKDKMLVFSLSGTEGTIQAPKLATSGIAAADLARVQETLVEIQARHTDERRIVAMFDASTPMQLVAETLATIRARPDGSPLFTDVALSAGFE